MSHRSPVIRLDVQESGGPSEVRAQVVEHVSTRPTYMFIPIGPRSMIGKSMMKKYLGALATELRSLDPGVRITQGDSRQPVGA